MRIKVRRYEAGDRDQVLALAPRLAEGVAGWRKADGVRSAVIGWVTEATARAREPGRVLFVATVHQQVAGFISAEERNHWTGELDVYIGELVVDRDHEGQGIGRALVEAAADWTRHRHIRRITLETGAANEPALAFYERLGFEQEDVRLSLAVSPESKAGGP